MDATKLMLEAFWLAQELNARLRDADKAGQLYRGHRLLRITGKAWDRYRRRMAKAQANEEKRIAIDKK